MGGGTSEKQPKGLKFSVELPHMKLDLDGSEGSLPEVRRIIEALNTEEQDEGFFEIRARLTDEFFQHQPLIARLRNALVLDEDVRILKRIIPLEQEYDLDAGKEHRQINAVNVKTVVASLFDELSGSIRECFIHIRGELGREQQCVVMDAVKQRLGMEVETRFFSTKKNLEGNVLVEAVCFGEALGEVW